MAIVIVRHGETDLNVARVVQPKDTPLSARGERQAVALAGRLARGHVGAVLCSDLARARMTAAPLLAALGMEAEYSPLLRERDLGVWCGTPYDRIPPDLFATHYHPEAGESWEVFYGRVARAFDWVVQRADGLAGDVVVVTHGFVCVRMLAHHARLSEALTLPTQWHNTSVSVIEREPPHGISVLNCVDHLGHADGPRGMAGL